MINKIKIFLLSRPLNVILWKLSGAVFKRRIPGVKAWLAHTESRKGVEIGGPSGIFRHYLPVYSNMKKLDGVNFSANTLWDTQSDESGFGALRGKQIIADGTDLTSITDESYEVLLSCNNLEHIANPIKALLEWKRVLKKDGVLICILPRKESNFDHRRPVTTLEHLIEDHKNGVGEDDLTHLEEILQLHDLKRDPLAGTFEQFKKRSEENFRFRALHHHVFDLPLLRELMNFIGMRPEIAYSSPMDHFILAVKD